LRLSSPIEDFIMQAILLTLALTLGTTPDDDARAALALANAAKPLPKTDAYLTYPAGLAESQAKKLPLVVFVGCDPLAFKTTGDLVLCRAYELPGYPLQCVVVGKDGHWLATLPCGCDEAAIRAAVKGGGPAAVDPFRHIQQASNAACPT
jgi:hypothetical protein